MSRRVLLLTTLIMMLVGCSVTRHPSPATPPGPSGQTRSSGHQSLVTTTTMATTACDASLWWRVYHPVRLHVVRPCLTVTGTILRIRHEPDGDQHILLTPDPAFRWTLQPANLARQHSALVLEPVCVTTPTQADAKAACAGYRNPVKIPPVGSHVKATGAYVLDLAHGWSEIHPVTSISWVRSDGPGGSVAQP